MRRLAALILLVTTASLFAEEESADWRVRKQRAWELRGCGADAVPELLILLADPEEVVRAGAAAALGHIGPDAGAAVAALRMALKDPAVRCPAAWALVRIVPDREDIARDVAGLLRSGSEVAEVYAVRALRRMGECVVPVLLDTVLDQSAGKRVRDLAMKTLRFLGARAVAPLGAVLSGKERKHRWAAILALGDLGSVAAAAEKPLLAIATGNDAWNAVWARCALIQITGREERHLDAIGVALGKKSVWRAAVQAIIRLGPKAGGLLPNLLKMLDDPDRDRRFQAVAAIGELGTAGRSALPELTKRDRKPDSDPYVRDAIRAAIQKLESAR